MIPLWLFYLLGFGIASCSFIAGFILCAMFRVGALSDTAEHPSKTTDDYIDWSKIPAGYDWVAVDGYDVEPCMFTSKPKLIESMDWWTNKKDYKDVPKEAIIGPLPPWRESLRRRPQ